MKDWPRTTPTSRARISTLFMMRPTIYPATIRCAIPARLRLPKPSQPSAQPANTASGTTSAQPNAAPQQQSSPQTVTQTITLAGGKKLQVPSLIGLTVRKVIEQAAAAGLDVQINGSGVVREQAPAPGTMVAPGTRIVVRCGR